MLSWNASSGLPEEHLLFDSHDVSMHLGGLNPLMRDHEQINVRSLTTRFKANTLRLPHLHILYQEGQCTRKELWLHGMLVDGKNIDISIQTSLESPQFKLAWNEGKWYKLYAGACILCIPAFTTITTNISQNGAEAAGVSWYTCLVWQHRGMDSESSRSYLGKIATKQSLPRPTI